MNISWYNFILVLKDGVHNAVFYSVTNWKPVYFSNVRWIDMRSRRYNYVKANTFVLSIISYRYASAYPHQLQQSLSTELDKGLLNGSS